MRCILCKKTLTKEVPINAGYVANWCDSCDLLATKTGNQNSSINKVNKLMYPLKRRIEIYKQRKNELFLRYRSIYDECLSEHGRQISSMLEIGSNIGVFANFVKNQGVKVTTVEINKALCKYQKKQYNINCINDISSIPKNEKFDLIVFMDVLEHIVNPVEILKTMQKYLSKNGLVFIEFPNKNSLIAKIAKSKWGWWAAPDHLYHFSVKSSAILAKQCGFHISRIVTASPILDDLSALTLFNLLTRPLYYLNRFIPLNILIANPRGSLIQLFLKQEITNLNNDE